MGKNQTNNTEEIKGFKFSYSDKQKALNNLDSNNKLKEMGINLE